MLFDPIAVLAVQIVMLFATLVFYYVNLCITESAAKQKDKEFHEWLKQEREKIKAEMEKFKNRDLR